MSIWPYRQTEDEQKCNHEQNETIETIRWTRQTEICVCVNKPKKKYFKYEYTLHTYNKSLQLCDAIVNVFGNYRLLFRASG